MRAELTKLLNSIMFQHKFWINFIFPVLVPLGVIGNILSFLVRMLQCFFIRSVPQNQRTNLCIKSEQITSSNSVRQIYYVTTNHPSRMSTTNSLTETPRTETPWTEEPLDREPSGQKPPGQRPPRQKMPRQRSPWTEIPWTEVPCRENGTRDRDPLRRNLGPGRQTGSDIMKRPPRGQNDRHV